MPKFAKSLLGCALIASAAPLSAEVTTLKEDHFITRDEAMVEADLKATWLALIAPAKWWNKSHTFTGDSANLSLTPQAGGCFCEKVPEISEPGRFTLEGSVEHLRVVNSLPETAIRFVGALGPLQSEPVRGVLTIALTKMEKGTRIVWEYNVAGPMRYEMDMISKAVDGVMTEQLNGLARMLGRIDMPKPAVQDKPEEAEPDIGQPDTAAPSEDDESDGFDDAFGASEKPDSGS